MRGLVRRFASRLLKLKKYGSPSSAEERCIEIPLGANINGNRHAADVAVICHLFHEFIADEVLGLLSNIDGGADIFITTDEIEKADHIERVFSSWDKGAVEVTIFPNRGRDVAPRLDSLMKIYGKYSYILFIHGKKSLTSSIGDDWRKYLFMHIAGSSLIVRSILAIFDSQPQIGIIFPQHFGPIRPYLNWDGNFEIARDLARRLSIELLPRQRLEFPSGSMFWARSAALKPLLDLNLTALDFPAEDNQTRATPAHAIERLILFICEIAGFKWIKVSITHASESRGGVVIDDVEGLTGLVTAATGQPLLASTVIDRAGKSKYREK